MKKLISLFFIIIVYTSYSEEKWEFIDSVNNAPLNLVVFIDFDFNDNLYIYALNGGLNTLLKKNAIDDKWQILANEDIFPEYNFGNIFHLYNCSFSNDKIVIWGASEVGGLFKYTLDSGKLSIIKGEKTYDKILGLTVDKNDNVWFASRTPYLSKYDGEKFTDWDVELTNKIIKIPFSNVKITTLDTNVFLKGTDGILSFSINSTPENMIYKKYSFNDLFFTDTVSNLVSVLCRDEKGRIWATDLFGNISFFENDKWQKLILPDSLQSPDFYVNGVKTKNYITNITLDSINNILYFFWTYPYFFFTRDSYGNFTKFNFPEDPPHSSPFLGISKGNFNKSKLWLSGPNNLIKYTPPTSGVEEEIADGGLIPDINIRNIYPNPSNSLINATVLIFPENVEAVHIGLYNSLGIKIIDLKDNLQLDYGTGEGTVKFDISGLPAGAYFFCIQKGTVQIARGVFKMD